jgi:hypothetical protein
MSISSLAAGRHYHHRQQFHSTEPTRVNTVVMQGGPALNAVGWLVGMVHTSDRFSGTRQRHRSNRHKQTTNTNVTNQIHHCQSSKARTGAMLRRWEMSWLCDECVW